MKKLQKITTAWLLIVILIQIISPLTSFAIETTETISFNDENLYKAIKEILNDKIRESDDLSTSIVIAKKDLDEIVTLNLNNKSIKNISGLEKFTALQRLELSSNELTEESNLEKLLELNNINEIDLSTNQIKNFEAIESINNKLIKTNQSINYIEIVKIDRANKQTNADVNIPQIMNYIQEDECENLTISGSVKDYNNTININNLRLKTGTIDSNNGNYTMYEGNLNINTTVNAGSFKGTTIKLTYILIDSESEGIIFKDENLYKAIKAQLTQGQLENDELASYNGGETLYTAAYDEELILVIKQDVLNNTITSLLLDNKQILDLTGIEYFRALESLHLSENYIEDVNKIDEVQKAKDVLRQEIVTKIGALKLEIAELNTTYTNVEEELKTIEPNKERKQDVIAGLVADYIRANNNNTITDETITSIKETVVTITAEDIQDNGICNKITGIEGAGGVYSRDGENLRSNLLELKRLLKRPTELNSIKNDMQTKINNKINEFKDTYLYIAKLISIISDETMKYDFTKINVNTLTANEATELKTKLALMLSTEVNALESSLDNLANMELTAFFDTEDKEVIKTKIQVLKDKIEQKTFSVTELKTLLKDLQDAQKDLNENLLSNDNNIDKIILAKRLENANTDKVTINYLEILNLNNNNISDLTQLSQIANLKCLYLGENLITDLSQMRNSNLEKSIEILKLNNNEYIEDVSYLQNFENLVELSLAGNSINDISGLDYSKFKNLEELDLSNNKISDLKDVIKQLKKLNNFTADAIKTADEKIAEHFLVESQNIEVSGYVNKTNNTTVKIKLPEIFSQAEKFQAKDVSFSANAVYEQGTATVILPLDKTGENVKIVEIKGGIAAGTTYIIRYNVIQIAESVSLDKTDMEIAIGETATLNATVEPNNTTNKNVVWSSSNEEVATVENGVITTKGVGTATITVKTEDGNKTAVCNINVKAKAVESISLDKTQLNITVEDTITLNATITPSDATNKNVRWSSDNEEVVICENGELIAVGAGSAIITATTEDGSKTATCSVTVVAKEQAKAEEPKQLSVELSTEASYKINSNYIEEINPKTNINSIKDNIRTNGEVKIVKGETEVTEGNMATGMKIISTLDNQTLEYTIVVTGDCNGDGNSDFEDILTVNKHRLNKVQVEGEYLKAADVTADGKVDFDDILLINKFRLGKINEY